VPDLDVRKIVMKKPHILFVCGRNKWRSPTAERIFKNDRRIEVRSAGVGSKSKRQINNEDILWADLILVMEKQYGSRIMGTFRDLELPQIDSLDIPDEYEFMEGELIELLEEGIEFHIKQLDANKALVGNSE
jgi:protein-tyrosine phosphatase